MITITCDICKRTDEACGGMVLSARRVPQQGGMRLVSEEDPYAAAFHWCRDCESDLRLILAGDKDDDLDDLSASADPPALTRVKFVDGPLRNVSAEITLDDDKYIYKATGVHAVYRPNGGSPIGWARDDDGHLLLFLAFGAEDKS